VLTIDGISFNTTEFEFFYNSEIMEYTNFMSQFQGMGGMLPEENISLTKQVYSTDPETGEDVTWAEMFISGTTERLISLVKVYNVAIENGFELSDYDKEAIEEELSMMSFQAMMRGFPTIESFLKQIYGNSINEAIYLQMQEFAAIASAYSVHVRDSFEYSDATIAEYYADNVNDLDVISYRQFLISVERPDENDFASDAEFDAALLDAAEDARSKATEIAENINSEPDFIESAGEYNEFYSDPYSTLRMTQGSRLDVSARDWLLDASRKYGDTTTIDTDQGTNIIMFVNRDDNDYRTVGMMQILILREKIDPMDFPEGEFDPGYILAVEQAEREATDTAMELHAKFKAAGETLEAFNELMLEYTDDITEDGAYSNIARFSYQSDYFYSMKVVPEIEDWLFDEGRVVGDFELIHSNEHGYHLLYFTGLGDTFFELIADDKMRTHDHTTWLDSLPLGVPVKYFAFRILVQL